MIWTLVLAFVTTFTPVRTLSFTAPRFGGKLTNPCSADTVLIGNRYRYFRVYSSHDQISWKVTATWGITGVLGGDTVNFPVWPDTVLGLSDGGIWDRVTCGVWTDTGYVECQCLSSAVRVR